MFSPGFSYFSERSFIFCSLGLPELSQPSHCTVQWWISPPGCFTSISNSVSESSLIISPILVNCIHQPNQKLCVSPFTPPFPQQLMRHRHGHDPSSSPYQPWIHFLIGLYLCSSPDHPSLTAHLLLSLSALWFYTNAIMILGHFAWNLPIRSTIHCSASQTSVWLWISRSLLKTWFWLGLGCCCCSLDHILSSKSSRFMSKSHSSL